MWDGNLYIAVNTKAGSELRCYDADMDNYRVVQRFGQDVCILHAVDDAIRRVHETTLVVQSEAFIAYIPQEKAYEHYYVHVIEEGEDHTAIQFTNRPVMIAYSGRSLATVTVGINETTKKEEIYPSSISLCSNIRGYGTIVGKFPLKNICQIVGDGHGAFIVRTIDDHKLYRLAYGTGYVEISTTFLSPRGVSHKLDGMFNMFFDKRRLIVLGWREDAGFHKGCCIVYDPDYEYSGSPYESTYVPASPS